MKKYKQGSNFYQMQLLVRCTLVSRWSFILTFIFLMLYEQTRYCTNRQIFKLAFSMANLQKWKCAHYLFLYKKSRLNAHLKWWAHLRLIWSVAATNRKMSTQAHIYVEWFVSVYSYSNILWKWQVNKPHTCPKTQWYMSDSFCKDLKITFHFENHHKR